MVAQCYTIYGESHIKPVITAPVGEIKDLIEDKFSDYKTFKEEMLSSPMGLPMVGLGAFLQNGSIKTTPNHPKQIFNAQ